MVSNTTQTVVVDGVDLASPVYKRSESEVVGGQLYVANGTTEGLGAMAFVKTDNIVGYYIKPIMLHETTVYDISGIVTPTDTTVYMSVNYNKRDFSSLKNNVIATAYADNDGNFNFSNVTWSGGSVYLWTTIWAEDAPTVSLTYDLSVVDYIPVAGKIESYSFLEPEGDYKAPRYAVTGTCSKDIEKIYVSATDNTTDITVLMKTLTRKQTFTDVGTSGTRTFEFEYDGEYDQNYVVWCITTAEGDMTVNSVTVKSETSVCLSGDTMITMADGSYKRMDNISVGDIVLTKDGVPSCVKTVRCGQFSDYHTLYHFENDITIDETHPHRFYNVDQGFWQRLQNWNIGDHAIDQYGNKVALLSVEHLQEQAEMFGIWTETGTYYANGLLSGQASCNKKLLEDASAEQAVDMMLSADEEWLLRLMGLEGDLP